jgi:hypothetical protein
MDKLLLDEICQICRWLSFREICIFGSVSSKNDYYKKKLGEQWIKKLGLQSVCHSEHPFRIFTFLAKISGRVWLRKNIDYSAAPVLKTTRQFNININDSDEIELKHASYSDCIIFIPKEHNEIKYAYHFKNLDKFPQFEITSNSFLGIPDKLDIKQTSIIFNWRLQITNVDKFQECFGSDITSVRFFQFKNMWIYMTRQLEQDAAQNCATILGNGEYDLEEVIELHEGVRNFATIIS